MATYPGSSSTQRAQRMRESWGRLKGGAGSIFVWLYGFFTTYPPLAQGLFYLVSGLWMLFFVTSYQQASGHQGDVWYADKIGILLLAIGGTLCLSAYRRQGTPEVLFLALACALGLTAVDIHMLIRGFSLFYLVDAILQLGLVVFWVHGWKTFRIAPAEAAAAPEAPASAAPPSA